MNGNESLEALVVETGKRKRSRMQTPVTWESLGELFESALNPKPEEPVHVQHFAAPIIPPEFPKLKVKYDGKTGAALEWIVVQNGNDENSYRTWYTEPMAKIEFLQATNVPERPAEEWQRRKQLAGQGR